MSASTRQQRAKKTYKFFRPTSPKSIAQLVGYEWFFQGWSAKEFREIKAGLLYA